VIGDRFLCSSNFERFESNSFGLDHCPAIWANGKCRQRFALADNDSRECWASYSSAMRSSRCTREASLFGVFLRHQRKDSPTQGAPIGIDRTEGPRARCRVSIPLGATSPICSGAGLGISGHKQAVDKANGNLGEIFHRDLAQGLACAGLVSFSTRSGHAAQERSLTCRGMTILERSIIGLRGLSIIQFSLTASFSAFHRAAHVFPSKRTAARQDETRDLSRACSALALARSLAFNARRVATVRGIGRRSGKAPLRQLAEKFLA